MAQFTALNTEGYTAAELATLNAAHAVIMAKEADDYGYDDDHDDAIAEIEKSVSDRLTNAFRPGITVAELVAAWTA
jgi:hypothetical protein